MRDTMRNRPGSRFRGLPRSWLRLPVALVVVLGGLALTGVTAAPAAPAAAGHASAPARAVDARAGGQRAGAPVAAASAVRGHASSGGARAGSAVPAVPWQQCAESWHMPPNWLCAMYPVPLDYAHPSAGTVWLAVAKLPAADPARRRGSVFFNPGGPGSAGLQSARAGTWEQYVGLPVRREYDLVTWDPRGTGDIEPPLVCLSHLSPLEARAAPAAVLTDAEMEARLKATAAIASGCAQQQLTRFVTTMDNVRDLDRLRQAVGDQKLSFVGLSYGTVIGAVYANVFPGRYRALVLHGVVDSTTWFQPSFAFSTDEGAQEQKTLDAALQACDAAPAICALAPNAAQKYAQLLDRVRELALDAGNSEQFSGLSATSSRLIGGQTSSLGAAGELQRCYQVIVVDGAESCPDLTAEAHEPLPPETWASRGGALNLDVRDATHCSDAGRMPDRWIAAAHQADRVAPVFGASAVLGRSMCASWSVFGERYTGGWDHGRVPILLLNQQWDQATPLAWAQTMTRRLGDTHLVTISGWGHTEPTTCSTRAVDSYLLTGRLPSTSFCADGRAWATPAPEPPAPGVAPGAYTMGTDRFVVYTGTGGGVWQKQASSAAPAAPAEPLGGRLVSAPSPVNAGGERIVFGEGTDHALWQKTGDGPWTSLGGVLTSKPGAAAVDGTSYAVYARGADGAVWARNHTTAGWGPWHSVGGAVLAGTGPSAAAAGGSFFVLAAGTNRELFIAHNGGGFFAAGGVTNSSPALVNAPSSGSLVGFAQGTNQAGFFHRFLPATPAWTSMGGILTSGTGGSSTTTGWYAYGLGTDSQVWEHAGTGFATGGWSMVTP